MALYVIGDLHLSLGCNKPMDVFGGAWVGYVDKLREGIKVITPEDTTVLLGDLSWAMSLDGAYDDFKFISEIPGRKIIVKGNHDYWWSTAGKLDAFCQKNGFVQIEMLHNNYRFYGDIALCGTRGWFYEEDFKQKSDEKVFKREIIRLEASLKAAGAKEKICFLHYPPIFPGYKCPEIIQLMKDYGVKKCYYGHLHGESIKIAVEGERDGINYRLVSADKTGFAPVKVMD